MGFKTNLLITFAVIFLDQGTKILAPKLGLTIVENKGVVFGLFPNLAWGIIILFLLLGFLINIDHLQPAICLIIGGGFSNLFDRLLFNSVRDFIDLKIWPVFNLADAAISLGVVLIFLEQVKASSK